MAGDIDAGGLVRLRRSVQVQGDVTSANRVLQEPGVAVAGTVTQFGHPEPFDPVPLPPVTSFTAGSQDVSTNRRARLWLTPGKYGKLDVGRDSELHLTAGDYFFDELKADRDFLIDLDVTGGDIAIFVTGSVQFDQGLDVDVVGGTAADVYLETHDSFQMKRNGEWLGTVFAPLDDITIYENSVFVGAAYSGERITVRRAASLQLVPSDRLSADAPPEIVAGLANDTGTSAADAITSDPAIVGTVTDDGTIAQLTLRIPEISSTVYDITSDLESAGRSFRDRSRPP